MGFLKELLGKKRENTNSGIITESTQTPSTAVIDMSKSKENLNKVLIDMSKNSKTNMANHKARVALAMDYSGSMYNLFQNGSVQKTVSRLLPIALKFDDNGELESWLFSSDFRKLQAVTESNFDNYVKKVMKKSDMHMGGTQYGPVLDDIVNYYTKQYKSYIPAFIIFITDGENSDRHTTDQVVRELSKHNMFVQFVGIGNAQFNYLRSLDNLLGRKYDNTGFISVEDMSKMNDEQLYTEILRQYKDWLNTK